MYSAGNSYGFKIKDQTETGSGAQQQFNSKEASGNTAQVVLTFG